MKKNDFLNQKLLQSPVAIIESIAKSFWSLLRQAWPILLISYFNKGDGSLTDTFYLWVSVAVFLVTIIVGIVRYYQFKYTLTEKEIIIEKGILKRTNLVVPYERVQVVNTIENFLHKATNTVKLRIESAGSSATEIDLDAITKKDAETIQKLIQELKGEIALTDKQKEEEKSEYAEEQLLVQLSLLDLLKVGLAKNHLRSFIFIVGSLFYLLQQYEGVQNIDSLDEVFEKIEFIKLHGFGLVILTVIVALISSIAFSLAVTISKYFQLKTIQRGEQLIVESGLIQKNKFIVKKHRIQTFIRTVNPIERLLDFQNVTFYQVGDHLGKKAIKVVGVSKKQLTKLLQFTFGDNEQTNELVYKPSKKVWFIKYRNIGIIPTILVMVLLYFYNSSIVFVGLFLLLPTLIYTIYWFKKTSYTINPFVVKKQSKIIVEVESIIEQYKLQTLRVTQSPIERRNNLATLHFDSAGRQISFQYLSMKNVRAIQNYCLHQIETSKDEWI